jgi:signal transduction histidine kinase
VLQADRFAAKAQRTLLESLAARPSPEQWRDKIAAVLDDASLRLGYRDPATGRFAEADGSELLPPPRVARAVWVPVDRDDQPVAAMVIDETLAEDPELVRAATSATLLGVENGALEGELRASHARILEAGVAERQRIERDLHDSAQQRLVALRIHLTLAGEQLERSDEGRCSSAWASRSTTPSTSCARSRAGSIPTSSPRWSARRSRTSAVARRYP